ncbi:DUF6438 domain-containing protein [Rhodanobacter sp. C01]|uniref:DUF6438 domain-containing protein n=1 Tax=Rhodanobacter sp. C01 TaxID=1945856 RepID=UPI0009851965|nr:DUF6438 domain-containing protein [Rhodanobacter sp. C01]OOG45560.1 hypothetical protein B0E50_15260 [Rhodanobacter sp. C01]
MMIPIFRTVIRCLLVCTTTWLGAGVVRADTGRDQPMHDAGITLQRSTCFGNCPGYSVTVTQDGRVSFEGHAHVQTDNADGRVTPMQVANILAAVDQAGFRSMRDSYVSHDDGCEMVMSDQSGVKITIVDAAGSKTVDFYNGCTGATADAVRSRIEQLARIIDQQLGTARWIGKPVAPGNVVR